MKSFFIKLTILFLSFFFLQAVVYNFICPPPELSVVNDRLKNHYRFLYYGDSVIDTFSPYDNDVATISEMASRKEPKILLGNVSHPGYHATVYEEMTDYIARSSNKPEAIVVEINLRSFSPEWDMKPEYQFPKEKFLYTIRPAFLGAFYNPLAVLRIINVAPISGKKSLNTPVYNGTVQVGTVADFEGDKFDTVTPENIKAKLIYHYMFDLSPDHRKLVSLKKMLAIAKKAEIKTYVYITPIDYQMGQKYIGKDFETQTAKNIAMICKIVREENRPCLDLSHSVSHEGFYYETYPNEHLNEIGRNLVAEKVSNILREGK
ncbi:MAG: hypothetical protein WC878_02805 [Candidatus Paceibacterota bacterium]|jgi:hypothetical protein